MVKRPTGSDGEPSSPNCGASAGVKARQPYSSEFRRLRCQRKHPVASTSTPAWACSWIAPEPWHLTKRFIRPNMMGAIAFDQSRRSTVCAEGARQSPTMARNCSQKSTL